jgi:reactive intermediate/imine deaminase
MSKSVINSDKAPAAIGTYSQAIKAGNTVYVSGQIPLDPQTMELVEGFEAQTVQVFENLKAVAEAAGASFKDIVKLNIFLTDLSHFAKVNEVMGRYFDQPYPARAAIGVAALPRGAAVEMDAILVLDYVPPAGFAPRHFYGPAHHPAPGYGSAQRPSAAPAHCSRPSQARQHGRITFAVARVLRSPAQRPCPRIAATLAADTAQRRLLGPVTDAQLRA